MKFSAKFCSGTLCVSDVGELLQVTVTDPAVCAAGRTGIACPGLILSGNTNEFPGGMPNRR